MSWSLPPAETRSRTTGWERNSGNHPLFTTVQGRNQILGIWSQNWPTLSGSLSKCPAQHLLPLLIRLLFPPGLDFHARVPRPRSHWPVSFHWRPEISLSHSQSVDSTTSSWKLCVLSSHPLPRCSCMCTAEIQTLIIALIVRIGRCGTPRYQTFLTPYQGQKGDEIISQERYDRNHSNSLIMNCSHSHSERTCWKSLSGLKRGIKCTVFRQLLNSAAKLIVFIS